MLPLVCRNVNVLIEAGGFDSRKYSILINKSTNQITYLMAHAVASQALVWLLVSGKVTGKCCSIIIYQRQNADQTHQTKTNNTQINSY